jgi:hypothetical protein
MRRRIVSNRVAVTLFSLFLIMACGGLLFHSLFAQRYVQTAADAINTGKTQLFQKTVPGVLSAYQTFQGAYASDYASASNADKIKIRVYLAATRMMDVVLRNDGGTVDTLTKLLAQYGVTRTGDAFDGIRFNLPLNDDQKIILPAGAPSSAEALRSFFSGPFLTAVNASIADMDAAIALCPATEGIDREIISKTLIHAGDATQPDVEMDAGDYWLFRALLKGMKAYALMCAGYNADISIRDVVAVVNMDPGMEGIKRLFDRYQNFLTISNAAKLNEARLTLIDAIDDYMIASEKIRNDNDAVQRNAEEFFSLEPDNYGEALLRENLAKIKTSLQGNTPADLVTERIGTEYSVYGGTSFSTTEPSFWEKGYHPENYPAYTYLGKASDTYTFTFSGQYDYYIITTKPGNMAPVDTVRGSDGAYIGTNTTGGTNQWGNVGGPPNGTYALIGDWSGGNGHGFIVIRPPTAISSLTVTLTNVTGIRRENHFQLNLFPLFGDGSTAPKAIRDMFPDLNKYGYPVPGTMGHGLGDDPTLGGILPDFTTQDQWTRENHQIFQPEGPVTIFDLVAAGPISVVDGLDTDWNGISPAFTYLLGGTGDPASDIRSLYLAKDATSLYLRIDTAGNIPTQFMSYGVKLKKLPGDQYELPDDLKVQVYYDWSSQWKSSLYKVDSLGRMMFVSNLAGTDFRVFGNHVEMKVSLAQLGPLEGRFLSVFSEPIWGGRGDYHPTCLQIQPSASVSGNVSVPGYDGGPVYIGVYAYSPDLSRDPKERIGSLRIYPDVSGNATYAVNNLPVGSRVFVAVHWDRDGNGVVSPGDYTNFSQPFTTVPGANSQNLAAGDDHPGYPAPRFYTAVVYHEKRPPSSPTLPGSWNVVIAAQLTGPSPDDVTVTVTGPGGEYTLRPGAVIHNKGLVYRTTVSSLPNGDYTFTAVDSLGRKTEATYRYEERYDLLVASNLSPASNSYVGTVLPTLSWTPPATGGPYTYQAWVVDFNYSKPNASTNLTWYVSDMTTNTSVTVPAGVLRPNTPYLWFVRLYDRADNPMNYTMSAVNPFYTGAYAAAPDVSSSSGSMGSRPPTGTNLNHSYFVNASFPGVAPWDVTGWWIKDGVGTILISGTGSPSFYTRPYDSFFEGAFSKSTPLPSGNYAFEMDINRSGTTYKLVKTGIPYVSNNVQAVDVTSLIPSNNYYFNSPTPTFSWSRPVADTGAYYYRIRIFDPLGTTVLWQSPWSQNVSATVPAGVLKPGGTYCWSVLTTPAINPSYVSAYVNTEGNSASRMMYRFTLKLPLGDVDGNGDVNLADAIFALQVVSGLKPTVTPAWDVNADNRVGLPDAIYILQEVSGLR